MCLRGLQFQSRVLNQISQQICRSSDVDLPVGHVDRAISKGRPAWMCKGIIAGLTRKALQGCFRLGLREERVH